MMQGSEVERMVGAVPPLCEDAMREARRCLDSLTKPPGSLGRLEELAVRTAGMTGEPFPDLSRKAVIVMAADHGVCEEGVSAYPAEVTPQMVMNIVEGGAAVNVLARHAGADVVCCDIGVNAELQHSALVARKIRHGTANIARGPAMSRSEAEAAIAIGFRLAAEVAGRGASVIATGEMGIGNTTPSAAILMALTGVDAGQAVGRGTGIDDARFAHKRRVVEQALVVNAPDPADALGVLAAVGGLEIAGLAGVILGAAANRRPVVLDGFISSAAALVAARLAPQAAGYMIASHLSGEAGHAALLRELGLTPMLHMDMRLGEGTGAVLTFPLIDAAQRIMREMATFESAGISRADGGRAS